MKVKNESEVAQSCPTPSDPMDCSPPGSSVHGIFQARVLEWGTLPSLIKHLRKYKNNITQTPTEKREENISVVWTSLKPYIKT